jgi:hypothetical protein
VTIERLQRELELATGWDHYDVATRLAREGERRGVKWACECWTCQWCDLVGEADAYLRRYGIAYGIVSSMRLVARGTETYHVEFVRRHRASLWPDWYDQRTRLCGRRRDPLTDERHLKRDAPVPSEVRVCKTCEFTMWQRNRRKRR